METVSSLEGFKKGLEKLTEDGSASHEGSVLFPSSSSSSEQQLQASNHRRNVPHYPVVGFPEAAGGEPLWAAGCWTRWACGLIPQGFSYIHNAFLQHLLAVVTFYSVSLLFSQKE